ncbi:MAG: iron-sulfur cluster assembly accessory protein [Candidatus Eremiobacteraeota bacterium]|nr:iron-sulfur cluster assembly accessory protein [Candidatus Eremiobacteraeota bacterium]MCW5872760.1 iron-sulfur cluster assembly accessory protein [Candidatus Eremiobacteraeota bacterium]
MVTLTDAAKSEVARLIKENNLEDSVLRMGVRGGGCSGLSYTLGFDKDTTDYDHLIEFDSGVRVAVDMKSALYLKGTEVDFTTDLLGGGFKFNNPNARKSCGCGSSFQP